jgi:hydrogenase maturation factor
LHYNAGFCVDDDRKFKMKGNKCLQQVKIVSPVFPASDRKWRGAGNVQFHSEQK